MIHNEVYNLFSHTYTHAMYFPFVWHFYVSAPLQLQPEACVHTVRTCIYPFLCKCYQKTPWEIFLFIYFFPFWHRLGFR